MVRRLRYLLCGVFFFLYGFFALGFAPFMLLPIWTGTGFRRIVRYFYKAFVFLARCTWLYRVNVGTRTLLSASAGKSARFPKGSIIVANHISLIDICVLMAHLPDSTAIAKAAALKNPVLATTVRKMFLVNDEDPAQLLTKARELLKRGTNIIIFPQGTREGVKLHRGAARLAIELQVPVVPVRLKYDPVILTKHQPWYFVGDKMIQISVDFGPTMMPPKENNFHNAKAFTNECWAWITENSTCHEA